MAIILASGIFSYKIKSDVSMGKLCQHQRYSFDVLLMASDKHVYWRTYKVWGYYDNNASLIHTQ